MKAFLKRLKGEKMASLLIPLAFLAISFYAQQVYAVTELLDGYYQVSRHGGNTTSGTWSYFPGNRDDYFAASISYQFLGHRHGASSINAEIWLSGSRGEGQLIRFLCSGSGCGHEYGGDHPFNFLSGGQYSTDSAAGSTGSNFRVWRAATVDDAEVRISIGGAAYYNDPTPPPPPPPDDPKSLTVSKGGTGSGTVSGPGISCGSDCTESYISGTTVSLSASASSGSSFGGWGGACSGTGSCSVSMTAAKTVSATFNTNPPSGSYTLTVTKGGTGSGTVSSSPSGVSCGSDCTQNYSSGTSVSLTASPASGSTFAGWSGSCSGTGGCTVSMTAARTVTATFNSSSGGTCVENASVDLTSPPPATLLPGENYSYSFTGTNVGQTSWYNGSAFQIQKTSGPTVVGYTCRNGSYLGTTDYGQVCNVSTATNGVIQDWTFTGTAPSTPGTYTIEMRMQHNAGYNYRLPSGTQCAPAPASNVLFGNTLAATLNVVQPNYTLSASVASGSGSVNSTGISCPGDCSESFTGGTAVTIVATPATDYTFSSWGGSCAGQGSSCTITMDANKSVSANFTYTPPFNYSLSNSGTSNVTKGSGTVYTQNTITKTLIAGATQAVNITGLAGLPTGTTYSVSNNPCSPNCSSSITISVSPSTPVGTHPLTVTASPLNKQTSFNLVVSGNPSNVTCSAAPSSVLLGQSVTWTASVSGGTPPYTYSWNGTNIPTSPAPSTNPYNISYSTVGTKSASVTVRDADGLQTNCPAATVQVNFDPSFEEF